jgi:prepilin-type N-terminal cleavage/methylation domain-containing protein
MRHGFTLLELLVVLIIIGVLSTLGITHYGGIREQAMDKEAIANVMLIMSAERIYRMEEDGHLWFISADIGQLNEHLKLSLTAGNNRNWSYAANSVSGPVSSVCVEARRNGADGRSWRMFPNDERPIAGTCNPV